MAHKTGAIGPKDLERVAVDTTVQRRPSRIPTDARLMHRAHHQARRARQAQPCAAAPELSAPGEACRHHGRPLDPRPPIQARPAPTQVPADAVGRIIRDIRRKMTAMRRWSRFGPLLDLAQRVRTQDQHQRGPKVDALHAPEVECIGKGKLVRLTSSAASQSPPP